MRIVRGETQDRLKKRVQQQQDQRAKGGLRDQQKPGRLAQPIVQEMVSVAFIITTLMQPMWFEVRSDRITDGEMWRKTNQGPSDSSRTRCVHCPKLIKNYGVIERNQSSFSMIRIQTIYES
jgi:hypothetical protein